MMCSYTYDVSHLPGGQVAPARVDRTIRENASIRTELVGVTTIGGELNAVGVVVGGTLRIDFWDQLDQQGKMELDGGVTQVEEDPPLSGSVLADPNNSEPVVSEPVVEDEDLE